jgi:hypothetical protein
MEIGLARITIKLTHYQPAIRKGFEEAKKQVEDYARTSNAIMTMR